MNRFWKFIFLIVLFPSMTEAAEPQWLSSMESCAQLSSADASDICRKIIRAREMLDNEHPRLIANKAGAVIEREVVLIAYDMFEYPHTVVVRLPLKPSMKVPHHIPVVTPGYSVERIKGFGPYKLEFRVVENSTGAELQVFGGKFLWIPSGYSGSYSYQRLSNVVEEKQYLPFLPHLNDPELVEIGFNFLRTITENVRESLQRVPSRAFPGRMLSDVYPSEVVMNLVISEHTDPYKLFDEKTPVDLPRASYFNGVLVELAIHGPRAFAQLCSNANACGWTQFTNKPIPQKKYPGTYTDTYNKCRTQDGGHVLLRDFTEGTREPSNALKAAFCYLDIENASLPEQAREEYLKDPARGSIYMLTAYHSGPGLSQRVFRKALEMRKRLGEQWSLRHSNLPETLFRVGSERNPHAHWYVKKYLWVWELYFAEHSVVVPVVLTGPN